MKRSPLGPAGSGSHFDFGWKCCRKLGEKGDRLFAEGVRNSEELDHVHPALTAFHERHEALILTEPFGEVPLCKAGAATSLDQDADKVTVRSAKDRLGHGSSRCPREPVELYGKVTYADFP